MKILPQAAAWAPPNPRTAPPLPPPNDHPLALDPRRVRLYASGARPIAFPTDGSVFNIGRDPANHVHFAEPCVSRHHAFGAWRDGQLWILDRSSRGTFLNGELVGRETWTPVPEGSTLDLGGPECRLTMGVAGTPTIMARLDELRPVADQHQLRLGDGSTIPVPEHGKLARVGRALGSDIPMGEGSVSRYHADVKYQLGSLMVRDVGSTYGTYVNGERVKPQEWVQVPEGGRVQFGRDPGSALSLEPKAPMVITFFGDSSVPDIGGFVEAQGQGFERALSGARSPAVVRGMVARGSALKDALYSAVPLMTAAEGVGGLALVGVGAGMALTGSVVGIPLAAAGAGLAVFGGWATKSTWSLFKNGVKSLKSRLDRMSLKPGNWKHVRQEIVSAGPSIKQFKSLMAENMARYPTSRHVVFLSGHGDQKGAAGLKYSQVGQVVKGADAIFLDACNGAQLEALIHLSDSTRVVVASEHTVSGVGFPLERMFGRSNFPDQPRDLGAALVQAASRSMPSQSLVAVDVKVLKEELYPALNDLGKWLNSANDVGWGKELKKALQESLSPSNGPGGLGRKVDLGSFLARIGQLKPLHGPVTARAQEALNKTILSMSGRGTVSFSAGGSQDLPPELNAFLRRL